MTGTTMPGACAHSGPAGVALALAIALAALGSGGCGQKGDLYIPAERQSQAEAPVPPATG